MAEMKKAMLAKDEKSLRGLRAIKAAIINAKTAEGAGGVLKEEDEVKMLQKLIKSRKDSLAIFQQQNREDLAIKEQEEIKVIEKFLPKQLTSEELREAVQKVITESSAGEQTYHKVNPFMGDYYQIGSSKFVYLDYGLEQIVVNPYVGVRYFITPKIALNLEAEQHKGRIGLSFKF